MDAWCVSQKHEIFITRTGGNTKALDSFIPRASAAGAILITDLSSFSSCLGKSLMSAASLMHLLYKA